MQEIRDRLKFLTSENPRSREIALAAGVLEYAQSRLSPLQFAQFQARCSGIGLPTAPGEAFSTRGIDGLRAMLDLIWGTLDEVQAANLQNFALNIQINFTITGDLEVDEHSSFDDAVAVTTTLDAGPTSYPDPAADLTVTSTTQVDGNVELLPLDQPNPPDVKLLVRGVDMGDGCVSAQGPLLAQAFGLTERLHRDAAETDVTTQAVLYESPGRGLIWRKRNAAGTDRVQAMNLPMIDTGWLDYTPGYQGDPSVPPDATPNAAWPQQKKWLLQIQGAVGMIGDAKCPLEVQVWTRKPPVIESDGTFGWPAGTKSIDKVHPAAGWSGGSLFTIRGCLPIFSWNGSYLELIVMPGFYGGTTDGVEDWYQLRVLIWHRGMH